MSAETVAQQQTTTTETNGTAGTNLPSRPGPLPPANRPKLQKSVTEYNKTTTQPELSSRPKKPAPPVPPKKGGGLPPQQTQPVGENGTPATGGGQVKLPPKAVSHAHIGSNPGTRPNLPPKPTPKTGLPNPHHQQQLQHNSTENNTTHTEQNGGSGENGTATTNTTTTDNPTPTPTTAPHSPPQTHTHHTPQQPSSNQAYAQQLGVGGGGPNKSENSFRKTVVVSLKTDTANPNTTTTTPNGVPGGPSVNGVPGGVSNVSGVPPTADAVAEAHVKAVDAALDDPLFKKVDVTINGKRDNIANEILTTEQSYVRSLTLLNELYRKPLLEHAKTGEFSFLTEDVVHQIFSRNIMDIVRVNTTLLTGLRERLSSWSDTQLLGDLLLDLTPFLKMYTAYTGNYERAVELLDELDAKESFVALLHKLGEHPARQGLNIRAFLIMPIQRIPRYRLLLEDLVRNTPTEHPDNKNLVKALEVLKTVAEQVDQAIAEQKNRSVMLKIQKKLLDSVQIIEPGRMFIKEGELTKICRKEHKKRAFFLFNDMLLYAKELPNGRFINHTVLKLTSVGVKDLPDDAKRNLQHAIQIASEKKSFVVYGKTAEEKQSWLSTITKALDVLDQNSKTLKNQSKQRRLSTLAPVWVPDDETKTCTICGVKFTITNRRHHCRQCGQIVCNRCSSKKKDLPGQGKQRVCDICFSKPYVNPEAQGGAPHPDTSEMDSSDDDIEENVTPTQATTTTTTTPISIPTQHNAQNGVSNEHHVIGGTPSSPNAPPPEIWTAAYDYQAPENATPRKLSFAKGATLSVYQKDQSGWWLAELNGTKGWVPAGYLQQ